MTHPVPHILLIGCGKMGSALLRGWLKTNLVERIEVVDPGMRPPEFASTSVVTWHADNATLTDKPDVVVLAVKPQQIDKVLAAYRDLTESALFLSIAAGRTAASIAKGLNAPTASIVRCMPNLPASIGAGISVAVANQAVTPAQRAMAETMLRVMGDFAWVENEELIDAVTALSGSGPAYVFALVEAMAQAGEKLGLPPALAQRLARQTVIGSGLLLQQSPDSAESLRKAVTSPGGTTAAALARLQDENGLAPLLERAMQAAAARAKELAQ